jgi:hypothetical protein
MAMSQRPVVMDKLSSSDMCQQCDTTMWPTLAPFFFFRIQVLLASPSTLRGLPIYAKTMDYVLDAQYSPSTHKKTRRYDWQVFDFIELEAQSCLAFTMTIHNDG